MLRVRKGDNWKRQKGTKAERKRGRKRFCLLVKGMMKHTTGIVLVKSACGGREFLQEPDSVECHRPIKNQRCHTLLRLCPSSGLRTYL